MAENTIKVRLKFSKHGPIRYIGHLDVMRYFQKCFRRAEIDIAYSSGYSPHQIMSFAQPLSVGHESDGEYMDVELNTLTSTEDLVNRLNEAGVDGIRVLSAVILPEHSKNAMASVAAASYTVSFKKENPFPSCKDAVKLVLDSSEVLIQKEGKNGLREVDIRQGIYALEWNETNKCFFMLLDASSGGNIKPIQVVEWMLDQLGLKGYENLLFVNRNDTFTQIGEGDTLQLVPLDHV